MMTRYSKATDSGVSSRSIVFYFTIIDNLKLLLSCALLHPTQQQINSKFTASYFCIQDLPLLLLPGEKKKTWICLPINYE